MDYNAFDRALEDISDIGGRMQGPLGAEVALQAELETQLRAAVTQLERALDD
jgi:hypothetical protein